LREGTMRAVRVAREAPTLRPGNQPVSLHDGEVLLSAKMPRAASSLQPMPARYANIYSAGPA